MAEAPAYKDNYVQLIAEQVDKFLNDSSTRRNRVTLTGYVVSGNKGQKEAQTLLTNTLDKLQPALVKTEQRESLIREEFDTNVPGVKIAKETEIRNGKNYTQYILFEGEF